MKYTRKHCKCDDCGIEVIDKDPKWIRFMFITPGDGRWSNEYELCDKCFPLPLKTSHVKRVLKKLCGSR
jgi:hypothetical protein